MRGVLLAGGYGSRLTPATNLINKHLLPIYSSEGAIPMIHYPLKTLRDSGITDIMIIVSRDRCGVMFETLGDGNDLGVDLTYRVQEMERKPTGIAQALKLSEDFVGDEKFAVILGDNFYEGRFRESVESFKHTEGSQHARIFLKWVHDPERFGVAELENNHILQTTKVKDIVEKPSNPKSHFAVTGLYFYTPHVFDLLPNLKPSARGELEITDINNWYVHNDSMLATCLQTFWSDAGTPEGINKIQRFMQEEKHDG